MLKDCNGLDVSTDDCKAIDAVNLFADQLLRLGKDVEKILIAAEDFPDCALIQAYAGALYLYAQTSEGCETAKKYLTKAQGGTPREKSFIHALNFWQKNLMSDALHYFVEHCKAWPQDIVAIKITEYLFFCKGQKFEAPLFLEVIGRCSPDHMENPLFMAILSFAQELNGLYELSRDTAEKAIALDADNPWAHHTLTHYYLNKGLINQGLKVVEQFSLSWPKFGRPIQSHNMWHLALFYLENLDFNGTLNVYRRANWSRQAGMVGEEIDAAALLWRLDFEGAGDVALWDQLASQVGTHANFCTTPFNSVHLIYSLKRGNRLDAVQEALDKCRDFVNGLVGEDRDVWTNVGMPLINGSLAYAENDFNGALHYFDPMIQNVGAAGGSDAQIDLFNQTYLKCLIGAKRFSDARFFLSGLTKDRTATLLEDKWLGECR